MKYDIEKLNSLDILEVSIKDENSLKAVIDWINFKRKMR